MIKIIIIDDEDYAREVIKEYLEYHTEIEILGEFSDGFSGLKGINELKPDLVFLDIQMPKLNGFEMLEILDDKPGIIFTTAYDQFAIQAFDQNAIDYLLKPFSRERFDAALNKFILKDPKKVSEGPISRLNETIEKSSEIINRIVVKTRNEIRIISTESIKYIEAQDDYVMIYLENEQFLKQKTMTYFENHLDPKSFIRVHRSYIVKADEILKIEPYDKTGYIIILKDKRSIPVSRSGMTRLKDTLGM